MACTRAFFVGSRSFVSSLHRVPLLSLDAFTAKGGESVFRSNFGSVSYFRTPRYVRLNFQTSGISQKVQNDSAMSAPSTGDDVELPNWKIKMLYDGECPLCMREVNMLRERNKIYNSIKFVDISSQEYSPKDNQGLDYETVMGRIHAILSDGTTVKDVEAFRKLYEEVGLGWMYSITKYEPIATIASLVYGIWAKYRLQITGRPSMEKIMELRKKNSVKLCRDEK
ncbi:Uncharacterized protein, mitochondrial [Zostera marina]|uniref:Uncharacterized protein, mitochondrial n=1 Tax=Zostera marina TaxID=29655 RepID=A0A0K9P3G3_ZOSMR|nr:Uncharacterized protein, mitochondrial [Zostera marina]